MKYSEYISEFLANEGYTHCYFVAGGNIMHLLDAARTRFTCIPVIHEVAAGIAVEYFNETNSNGKKAFALVTAGPGLTNIVTALAGAFLESRELLVLGGQVKNSDLKSQGMRQRGIQEVDGVDIVSPITKSSLRLNSPMASESLAEILSEKSRPGPIFIEIPLDVQASEEAPEVSSVRIVKLCQAPNSLWKSQLNELVDLLKSSERPVLLLGGGLNRKVVRENIDLISSLGIPIMTTWNGADRYGTDLPNFWGRPNTWGQRSANILIQQADLIVAFGSRLGLQQTGFAWEEFAPLAKIFQIDIDPSELSKGHPKIHCGIEVDAATFLIEFLKSVKPLNFNIDNWLNFGKKVISNLPLNENVSKNSTNFVDPYALVLEISDILNNTDVVIPCSSGGAFTVTLQAFNQKYGQTIVSNKGLASMGYGLSGAIGAAQSTNSRVVLLEGDGGFAQNLQELGTLARQNLNIKIVLFENSGYASIRMTQKNYFGGAYLGCDIETGLGLPNWELIAKAYGINFTIVRDLNKDKTRLIEAFESADPEFIVIAVDPEQTYFPKITSRLTSSGSMASNPLHLMSPDLTNEQISQFLPYLMDRISY